MNKQTVKEFIDWLDNANNEKIIEKKEKIQSLLSLTNNHQLRADLRFLLKLIDQEVIARSELFALESKPSKRR